MDSHIKVTGMLVVSLRGVNCRFFPRRIFGTESHYICPSTYRLELYRKNSTKNDVVSVVVWSPLGVSLGLGHTHIGFP